MTDALKAPFPYFGGKARVADRIWRALGQPAHYIEPFFGSGAVLLARPDYDPTAHTETVNDKDGFICNVWRALKWSPDDVAEWCDWPVNHADLMARKREIIRNEDRLLENLVADPEWHDAKQAGCWIWAACCWIGSGLTRPGQRPDLGNKGKGVHKASLCGQIPHLADKGAGVHKASLCGQRPHLADKGRGVHRQTQDIREWFAALSARLRRVRVVCGDWARVCGGDWQDHKWPTVGMFFDPPYGVTDRDAALYHHDSTTVAADVMAWCVERGARGNYRIALAGYDEYEALASHGWRKETWSAGGGYANSARKGESRGHDNRHRETLWFSPACETVPGDELVQETLFGAAVIAMGCE